LLTYQIRMNYRSGTDMRCYIFVRQMIRCHLLGGGKHFAAWKDVMASTFKLWPQIKNQSIDSYLLEKHSCQISSRFDLKRHFWRGRGARPNKKNRKKKNDNNRMSNDMRSVPDVKICNCIRTCMYDSIQSQRTLFSIMHHHIVNLLINNKATALPFLFQRECGA